MKPYMTYFAMCLATIIILTIILVIDKHLSEKTEQESQYLDLVEQEQGREEDKLITAIEYDGCEYLIYHGAGHQGSRYAGWATGMTHKGNCNNPIHKSE